MTPTQAIKAIDLALEESFKSRVGTPEERSEHRDKLRECRKHIVNARAAQRITRDLANFARLFNDPKLNAIIARSGY